MTTILLIFFIRIILKLLLTCFSKLKLNLNLKHILNFNKNEKLNSNSTYFYTFIKCSQVHLTRSTGCMCVRLVRSFVKSLLFSHHAFNDRREKSKVF